MTPPSPLMPWSPHQIRGCLLAGAIGDASGARFEGVTAPRIDGLPWEGEVFVTDDTQLTMATLEAVVEEGGVDPESIAARLAEWHRERRIRGIGASTFHALEALAAGGHWALCGRRGEHAAGNGAAMRIAPLAVLLDPTVEAERRMIRDVCRITHHNEEAYAGALAITLALNAAALDPVDPGLPFLDHVARGLPDSLVRDRLREIVSEGLESAAAAMRFGCGGYVAESVPIALLCAATGLEGDLGHLLQDVIRLGGDTDTNASLAAQIFGARRGIEAIPEAAVTAIKEASLIDRLAVQLAHVQGPGQR